MQEAQEKKEIKVSVSDLNLHYGAFHALINVALNMEKHKITALIGPSGCGKSTLLRCLNRMNDLIPSVRITGRAMLDNTDIYAPGTDVCELRKKIGMVFQRPNPFPLSIWDNVVFGLRVEGKRNSKMLAETVKHCLGAVGLWDNLKDKLDNMAIDLPLEQQQRLCIARLAAVEPEVILMDEPCSALDPIATAKIEELMLELKRKYTIIIVTHNMQQAARISDYSAYMLMGEMIEFAETSRIFTNPKDKRTEDYISGRYG
jgi:phosphate transport system ATP-binding protein